MHFECDISSIHFPHPREDEDTQRQRLCIMSFNPLPSSEGRRRIYRYVISQANFNPLPSSEGRQAPKDNGKKLQITSIHFPHPREDDIHRKVHRTGRTSIHFPHPREDSDTHIPRMNLLYFNPLPSSEGRQTRSSGSVSGCSLQSTSLIRGKTPQCYKVYMVSKLQSTSLIRGKTPDRNEICWCSDTSIHFPHPREDSKTS